MAPRLSGQTSIFGVVFFVSKSLLGIERQKKLKKFTILTRKPRSHVRILIYRTWAIEVVLALTRCIYMTKPDVCIKARSPPASLLFKGQVSRLGDNSKTVYYVA